MQVLRCVVEDIIHAADRRRGRMPDIWRVGHGTYKAIVKEMATEARAHRSGKIWVADNAFVYGDDPPPRSIMILGVVVQEIRSYEDAPASEKTGL